MSAAILLQGKLERAPESRISRNGNGFLSATLRVATGSELQFWRIFVFSESARAELARLGEGDALAVQGTPKFEIWRPEGGEPRVSLGVTAEHVLALKQPPRERKPKSEKKPQQYRARRDRPAVDAQLNDDIPF
ncbi:MAG: OB-fold nucleic acid binding domain-containing protein [Methylocystis sp.]